MAELKVAAQEETGLVDDAAGHGSGLAPPVVLLGADDAVAGGEVGEGDTVGEALAGDADALQHAVAAELVEQEGRVDEARLAGPVGHQAADEVGGGGVERGQQAPQLALSHQLALRKKEKQWGLRTR